MVGGMLIIRATVRKIGYGPFGVLHSLLVNGQEKRTLSPLLLRHPLSHQHRVVGNGAIAKNLALIEESSLDSLPRAMDTTVA